jgi:hypothetical protein
VAQPTAFEILFGFSRGPDGSSRLDLTFDL